MMRVGVNASTFGAMGSATTTSTTARSTAKDFATTSARYNASGWPGRKGPLANACINRWHGPTLALDPPVTRRLAATVVGPDLGSRVG